MYVVCIIIKSAEHIFMHLQKWLEAVEIRIIYYN